MTAMSAQLEHLHIDARTRRATLWSVVAHALLLVWMILQPHVLDEVPQLTEITWIDPEALPPYPPSAARAPEPVQPTEETMALPAPPKKQQHFTRLPRPAASRPTPQLSRALQDRLSQRLTTLQQTEHSSSATPAAVRSPIMVAGVRPPSPSEDTRPAAVTMRRASTASARPALEMKRATGTPAVRLADLPVPAPEPHEGRPQDVDPSRVRHLAGASLAGPVIDRALLAQAKPAYPEWAKSEAIEGSVSLYFFVRPNGRIKENIVVEKTSGFEEFDLNAIRALREWKFEPLGRGATGEQWGRITFHFRLR